MWLLGMLGDETNNSRKKPNSDAIKREAVKTYFSS
jgi:hypothetical protein